MSDDFSSKVQSILDPLLLDLGFTLDEIDDNIDEGGRRGSVVYYRSQDCKLQIYWSSREGEINCMIGPLDAPNEPGLYNRSTKWHYLNEFTKPPDLPLEELVRVLREERVNFESDVTWLEWLRERIGRDFDAAHAAVLKMYG